METSTQIIVIYRENKADIFDKLVLEVAHKYSGSHMFSGTKELSVAEQTIATVKKVTFKFPDKDSRGVFISELSEFDGIAFEENPWLKMAGKYQDNPLFEEVVAYIEANRQNDYLEEHFSPSIEVKENKEYPLYSPPLEIQKIVKLLRKSINLISDLKLTNPWNDPRMNQMLHEFIWLFCYQIEQFEGILCMAESNLYLYPSALVISRTVLEINILIEWLLQPEEETERVIRYIRYLNSQLANIDNHTNNIELNAYFPISEKEEIRNNKDAILKDIVEMKAAAIKYGISEEDIPQCGIPPITRLHDGMIDQVINLINLDRQINLKIAYYTLSKFSHGMRQSIL